MYQALYRKYRPKTFDDIIAQDHVTGILKNQIAENKLSHAYIFSGPRGTGKTTTAKVFSMAVNCQNYDKIKGPCGKCSSCMNNYADTLEIDAASNNSVDNIRKLQDEIMYMPSFGKYKVYIIDEAHMLSQGAFNALLKTLEEPPEHVIFILATTQFQKLPDTIVSRCQRFEFKKIDIDDIKEKLIHILDLENISYDEAALEIIAKNSNGGLRDAINLADQIAAYGQINAQNVLFVLGKPKSGQLIDYINALSARDVKNSLICFKRMRDDSSDIKKIPAAAVDMLRKQLLKKFSDDENNDPDLAKLSVNEAEAADLIIKLSDLDAKLRFSSYPDVLFDAFTAKYCVEESLLESALPDNLAEKIAQLESRLNVLSDMISNETVHIKSKKPVPNKKDVPSKKAAPQKEIPNDVSELKEKALAYLKENKMANLAAFLIEGDFSADGNDLAISFDDEHTFHMEQLSKDSNKQIIKAAFDEIAGKDFNLIISKKNNEMPEDDDQKLTDEISDILGIDADHVNII